MPMVIFFVELWMIMFYDKYTDVYENNDLKLYEKTSFGYSII